MTLVIEIAGCLALGLVCAVVVAVLADGPRGVPDERDPFDGLFKVLLLSTTTFVAVTLLLFLYGR